MSGMSGGNFRSIAAMMMAMAMGAIGRNNVAEVSTIRRKSVPVAFPVMPVSSGICFHRTFTGKRVRNGKKKRNMNHLSKLTRMKHARA